LLADEPSDATPGAPRLPVPLRPMTTSDLLDGGFAILKNRPGVVFGTCALVIIPIHVVQALLTRNVVNASNPSPLFNEPTTPRARGATASDTDLLAGYAGALLATLGIYLVGAVVARLVSAWYAGGDLSTGETLRAVLRATPSILVAWLLISLVNAVGWMGACIGWFFINPLFLVAGPPVMLARVG